MPRAKDDGDGQTQQHAWQRGYRQRSDRFIASTDLDLRPDYHSQGYPEPHIYPDSNRSKEVKYKDHQERVTTQKTMLNGIVADTSLVGLNHGKTDLRENLEVLFTRHDSVMENLDHWLCLPLQDAFSSDVIRNVSLVMLPPRRGMMNDAAV